MNKVNTFPDRTNPFPLILHSNLFIPSEAVLEGRLLNNQRKIFLAKTIAKFVTTLFIYLIYLARKQEIHPIK